MATLPEARERPAAHSQQCQTTMPATSVQLGTLGTENNDLALVHASQNGDVSAFERLVEITTEGSSELPTTLHIIARIPRTWFRRPS